MQDPGGEVTTLSAFSQSSVSATNPSKAMKYLPGLGRASVVSLRPLIQAGLGAKKDSTSVMVLVTRYGGRDWRKI